jgi:hypothetical protein
MLGFAAAVIAQEDAGIKEAGLEAAAYLDDPASLIGLSLDELLALFGAPKGVYAVRGAESWQDDVVFEYKDLDFYLYRNIVWQVSLQAAYGLKIGDSKEVVAKKLGAGAGSGAGSGGVYEDFILYSLPPTAWSLNIKVNFKGARAVSIYIYRGDM